MKNLQQKLLSLIYLLKGKSKKVIIGTIIVLSVCVLGVKYGYLSEDMINIPFIIGNVEVILDENHSDSIQQIVDTLKIEIDSSNIKIESL